MGRTTATLLAATAMLALAACSASTPDAAPSSASPSPTGGPGGPGPQISKPDALTIHAAPFPDWITVVDGEAWVANVNAGLARYDADGDITAEVEAGDISLAMDVGFGSLWLGSHADAFEVVRVDLDDPTQVTRISTEGDPILVESSVAVTDNAVWVLVRSDTDVLAGIDPSTDSFTLRHPAPVGASALRGGFGSLWVTSHASNQVTRIDPTSGAVLATIDVGQGPQFLSVGEDAVWVMNQTDGSVSRVDPETNSVVATIATGHSIQGGDIAAGPGAVWVRTSAELAVQIDPATNEVVDSIGPAAGSGGIAFDEAAVWIAAHDILTVWRVPID